MNTKERISADFLTAFKGGNKTIKNILGMLKSEIGKAEKAEGQVGELTEAQVQTVVIGYAKNVTKTIESIKDKPEYATQLAEAQVELSTVQTYLPEQLSKLKMRSIIELIGSPSMPEIMKHFGANYKGQYNPADLKSVIDNIANKTA